MYENILVIINQLTKMVHYVLVKMTIDAPGLAKVIIDIVIKQHNLPNSIVFNKNSLFVLNFCSSLYYFFDIKHKLSTVFYPQTNGQIEG